MTEILLTVVVPSYNQAAFIRETLAEPIRLRARGVEVIVMDGGSTDGTADILRELDGQIDHWVSEKDRGQAHAINKGFARARGRWIAFQNSDDYYVPGALDRVLDVIERQGDRFDLMIGGARQVGRDGTAFKETLPKPIFFPALSQMNFIQNQALFIARDWLDRVGPIREEAQFCLDYEWFLRIFKAKPRVALLPFHVGAQRFHEDTKTHNNQEVHDREFARFAVEHFSPGQRVVGKLSLPFYRMYRQLYLMWSRSAGSGR